MYGGYGQQGGYDPMAGGYGGQGSYGAGQGVNYGRTYQPESNMPAGYGQYGADNYQYQSMGMYQEPPVKKSTGLFGACCDAPEKKTRGVGGYDNYQYQSLNTYPEPPKKKSSCGGCCDKPEKKTRGVNGNEYNYQSAGYGYNSADPYSYQTTDMYQQPQTSGMYQTYQQPQTSGMYETQPSKKKEKSSCGGCCDSKPKKTRGLQGDTYNGNYQTAAYGTQGNYQTYGQDHQTAAYGTQGYGGLSFSGPQGYGYDAQGYQAPPYGGQSFPGAQGGQIYGGYGGYGAQGYGPQGYPGYAGYDQYGYPMATQGRRKKKTLC